MDLSIENAKIISKNDCNDLSEINQTLLNLYYNKAGTNVEKTKYNFGETLAGTPYKKFIEVLSIDKYKCYTLNSIFIENTLKSYYTKELNDLLIELYNTLELDYFMFFNCKTGINFKSVDIKNKVAFDKKPYYYLLYTNDTPDIKKSDLNIKLDKKYVNKKIIYIINFADYVYINKSVYNKIIEALQNNKEFEYLLIFDDVYVKNSPTYENDILMKEEFYKKLYEINFSLDEKYNIKMFCAQNIFDKRNINRLKIFYPYGNYQEQLLFKRKELNIDNKEFKVTKINKAELIYKSINEYLDHLIHYEFYLDYRLNNLTFIINEITSNLKIIEKSSIYFILKDCIIEFFKTLHFDNIKKLLFTNLFIKEKNNKAISKEYQSFVLQLNFYTNIFVKYGISDGVYSIIHKSLEQEMSEELKYYNTLSTDELAINEYEKIKRHIVSRKIKFKYTYNSFISNKCSLCLIKETIYKCGTCKKSYCSKECQKLDWKYLNHKILCKSKT
jgi:hypothetical protein